MRTQTVDMLIREQFVITHTASLLPAQSSETRRDVCVEFNESARQLCVRTHKHEIISTHQCEIMICRKLPNQMALCFIWRNVRGKCISGGLTVSMQSSPQKTYFLSNTLVSSVCTPVDGNVQRVSFLQNCDVFTFRLLFGIKRVALTLIGNMQSSKEVNTVSDPFMWSILQEDAG